MPIRYLKPRAVLEGHVVVEDAEPLAAWLTARRRPTVALRDCGHVHAAVLQVLLALRPRLAGRPSDEHLARALAARPDTTTEGAER